MKPCWQHNYIGLPEISYPNLFVSMRFVPQESLSVALTLSLTLALIRNSNSNPNPNITTSLNPNSKYLTLTLLKNGGYEMHFLR